MEILDSNKEGANVHIGKDDAVIVFSKEGVTHIAPQSLLHLCDVDGAKVAIDKFIKENNPNLSIFMAVLNFLDNEYGDHKQYTEQLNTDVEL